ncbi:hypothetical protein FW320_05495 [Azospirillum sp. Vi22]|uniref:hypothetical protein n=1 Tax=Azospirillum baldaniorum TaxID=1064539 RepID=UPI00157B86AA|nr:hypothetical protein [Azospirillum baldaniorum]NUB05632.1 hypothetical protein [Azospirillum baldaniorum]
MNAATELRLQRLVTHLHSLGPRAMTELLTEFATAHGAEADLLDRLERYARLDPGMSGAFGGDRFPPRPLALVR